MKSIKINTQQIRVTFDTENEAQRIYSWMDKILNQDYATVTDNNLTYDLSHYQDKFYPIQRIFGKAIFDVDNWENEVYSSAFSTDLYNYMLTCSVKGDKLLKVTPFNSDGTLGTLDFPPYQYITNFRLVQLNKTGEVYFLSARGHVGDNPMHEVLLSDDVGVLIEVGTFQL